MKVKGIRRIYKTPDGQFYLKFEVGGYSAYSGSRHYWRYVPCPRSNKMQWESSYCSRRSKYYTWTLSTPFEFMLLTGVSLLSAIKYGKIYGPNRAAFLDIRRDIRRLNPVPRRQPKPKKIIWQLRKA